jgi:hypothetical protein
MYCIVIGKLNRGMSVVDTVEILKGSELSEAEYLQAAILGWGIELVGKNKLPSKRLAFLTNLLYSFKPTFSSPMI